MKTTFLLSLMVFLFPTICAAQGGPTETPAGNLAEVMRSVFFINSNTLFDVQSNDPDDRGETSGGQSATERFGSLYAGWVMVDAAAVALAEGANLLILPGRMCSNGEAAPLEQEDWTQFSRQMEEAGRAAVEAAKTRDQATVSNVTNEVVAACTACHSVYRDSPGGIPDRCKVGLPKRGN